MAAVTVPDGLDVVALERVAVEVALSAGTLITRERPRGLGVASTKSTQTDVVTVMDQRSQDHLLERLFALRPDDAVLGEEEGGRSGSTGVTWVVDPIDGTVNYLYELPAYAVSVAAVVGDPRVPGRWTPVAACVVNPVSGEVFRAAVGHGAHLGVVAGEERRLSVEQRAGDLATALVATGFAYAAATRAQQARLLVDLLPQVRDIRRLGSAALDLCRLAAGEVDAYFESGLNAWDLAGGWLVATEAGLVVGGPEGPGSAPERLLTWACHPALATDFGGTVVDLVRRHPPFAATE